MNLKLLFLILPIFLISCRNETQTKKNKEVTTQTCLENSSTKECQENRNPPVFRESTYTELLESIVDIPIEVSSSYVYFGATKSYISRGKKLICDLSITKGESLRFDLYENDLHVFLEDVLYKMKPLTSSGEGLLRSWIWKGVDDSGVKMTKQLSFIGSHRLIMRKTCEI